MIDSKEIKNAALEAIYGWNRTEGYYYSYFSKLDELYEQKDLLEFFMTKIFQPFLKDYSIRRNIKSKPENVDKFLDYIMDYGFVENIKNGEISTIDTISQKLKNKTNVTNKRECRSLLSKVAFLINPNDFSLLDTLAKNSLWELIKNNENKCTKSQLNNYTCFMEQTEIIMSSNRDIIKEQSLILKDFEETEAHTFFTGNYGTFERRIIDKHLWLKEINSKGREVNNSAYCDFLKIHRLK